MADTQNTRRLELKIGISEAKRDFFDLQVGGAGYNIGGATDSDVLDSHVKYLKAERGKVAVDFADKKMELFDLQGE